MKSALQKQLDRQKFLNTIDQIRHEARGPKILSLGELVHINRFLSGKSGGEEEPWRVDEVRVHFKGKEAHVSVLSNPMNRAREIISHAVQLSASGHPGDGAFYVYAQLVLAHLFKEANRRTAVAAALWILTAANWECEAEELLNFPVGDLREESDKAALHAGMLALMRPAQP